jgi:hypothetical protein
MPDDFFEQEQKMATRAMMNCCGETWQVIEQDTNIKPLIRKRPLTSLAVAVAAGLAAGYLLAPSRGRKPDHEQHGNGHAAERRSLLVMLERQLARALLPVLRTFAVTTTGMVFSDIHKGSTDDRPSAEEEQAIAPQPPMQP